MTENRSRQQEVKTYRLDLIGTVMKDETPEVIRRAFDTPPIILDKTLVVAVDDNFLSQPKEEQEAQVRGITESIVRDGGQYENILFIPKGFQFMRAIEV